MIKEQKTSHSHVSMINEAGLIQAKSTVKYRRNIEISSLFIPDFRYEVCIFQLTIPSGTYVFRYALFATAKRFDRKQLLARVIAGDHESESFTSSTRQSAK